jgi:tetratricopeptide (TPR) repeat protein
LERYQAALAIDSAFAEGWNDLGVVLFRRGDYDQARAAFTKATELKADYGEALFNLHDTLDELGLSREREAVAARLRELGIRPGGEE